MAKWAVLVYMASDVPSEQMRNAAKRNLQQMANIGSSDQVAVAAQIDLTGQGTSSYVFPAGPGGLAKLTPVANSPNINSASPDSITNFVKWATSTCPAENTLMVFWGHGFGIDDFNPALLPNAPEAEILAANDVPKAMAMAAHQRQVEAGKNILLPPALVPPAKNPSSPSRFSLLFDHTSNAELKNNEFAGALSNGLKGQKLAILGFDCCEMAMAEVWSEMENSAQLCVGAQSGIPYSSWPYDQILSALVKNPEMAPAAFSSVIVDKFVNYYDTASGNPLVTLSVSNLGALSGLLKSVKSLATELSRASNDSANRVKIFTSRNSCPIFDDDGFIDFDCFCGFLEQNLPASAVSRACRPVRVALRQLVTDSKFAPETSHLMISLSKGLSVWFPGWIQFPNMNYVGKEQSVAYLANGYSQTQFAQTTGWDKFLNTLKNTH
jgi:hypothetical protein